MEKRTVKRILAAVLLFPFLFFLASCSETGTSFTILRGNLLFRSGEEELATYSYLQAKQRGAKWEDWIDYDLGTLYVSLGEIGPGIRVLNRALEDFSKLPTEPGRQDRELFFRGFFNLGVAHYEIGSYRQAAAAFMQALRLKADSWEAKINLELSLEAMLKTESLPKVQAEKLSDRSIESDDPRIEQLLETINREEKPGWLSAPIRERFEQDW